MPDRYLFMGLRLPLSKRPETLEAIDAATSERPVRIATPNGEFYLKAQKQPAFKRALESMTHCTVDGSGPFFMLKLWTGIKRLPAIERYAGADMVADLFERYQNGGKSFFFLGGPLELVDGAAAAVKKTYPRLRIVGQADGGRLEADNPALDPDLIRNIAQAGPDILLVGFGAPKQELWIQKASTELAVPVMIGIGGTFGFYVNKKRASGWVRSLHLEWLSRMLREPGHGKRVWQAVVVFSFKSLGWMASHTLSDPS